jgi:DNA (cytosine-5)-methyltransferase 1
MRLLDLFCCQGGAGEGYRRAGFDVTGVDIEPQPRNPHRFIQADAIDYLLEHGEEYDAIAASPPCQAYSRAFKHLAAPKPMLLDVVRAALDELGKPYAIENVIGAPMPEQPDLFGRSGVVICGSGLGLRVHRHRIFESNVPMTGVPCAHGTVHAMNPHNQAGRDRIYEEFGRCDPEIVWREHMGVPWMDKHGGRQAIPPAYTEHIGGYLMVALTAKAQEAA